MKKIAILSAGLFAAALVGCEKNEPAAVGPKFGEPTEVSFTLESKSTPSRGITGTTVAGVGNENLVTSLEFYIFDDAGTALDPAVSSTTPGYIKFDTDTSGGSPVYPGLTQKIKVSSGNAKKVIVIANMSLGSPASLSVTTYAQLKALLSTGEFGTGANDPRVIPDTGLEMSGFTETAVVEDGRTDNRVYITISRLVSKVNAPKGLSNVAVELTQQEDIDKIWDKSANVTTSSTITFAFEGYAVINGLDKSNVSFTGNASGDYKDPKTTAWDTWVQTGKSHINSAFDSAGDYVSNYSGVQYDGEAGESLFLDGTDEDNGHRVYTYESKPASMTSNGITGYDPLTVYAYIVKGDLTANGVTVTRYWRVNLVQDDNYHMMRNCSYDVTIAKITSPGHATPKDAETDPVIVPEDGETAADFIVSIADWDINEYETNM